MEEQKKSEAPVTPPTPAAASTTVDWNQMGTPIAIVIAGGLVAAALIFGGNGGGAPAQKPVVKDAPSKADIIPVAAGDHIFGNPEAPVKIIEYTDLECPFCKRFHGTMQQIVQEFDGQVAWVVRNFPLEQLHPNAPLLALTAECIASTAGNDAYWKFLDEIVVVAPLNTPFPMNQLDATVTKFAPLDAVKACVTAGTHVEKIQKQIAEAVASGGNGTPHSIIIDKKGNPTLIQGAQPVEVVRAAVEKALK
jgi:protein-disulfide isomerase